MAHPLDLYKNDLQARLSVKLARLFPAHTVDFQDEGPLIAFWLVDRLGRSASWVTRLDFQDAEQLDGNDLVARLRLEESFWSLLDRRVHFEFMDSRSRKLRNVWMDGLEPDPPSMQTRPGYVTGRAWPMGGRNSDGPFRLTVSFCEVDAAAFTEGRLWPVLDRMPENGWVTIDLEAKTLDLHLD